MGQETTTNTLFERLRGTKRLPSPPGAALRVLELCRREDADIQQIADVVMSDSVLAGRVLKFANSPMAGIPRQVTSVREALLLLGLRTVKLTALGFCIAMPGQEVNCPQFDLKRFWAASCLRAVIARRLCTCLGKADREETFTAALLAGLGQLALAQGFGKQYNEVLEEAKKGKTLQQAELDIFGTDHHQISALLLHEWGLPDVLVEAISLQSKGMPEGEAASPEGRLAWIICVARDLLPSFANAKDGTVELTDSARRVVQETLKVDAATWRKLSCEVFKDYRELAALIDVELEDPQAALEIYAEAQEQATRVGMVAQLERAKAVQDNADLMRLATTDALTGIANRAKFDERIRQEVLAVQRGYSHFALLMLDIDHFKKFNDSHGHQAGDLVLKRVAIAIQNALREVDLVARYGGEEFAVVMPHTDRMGACLVAARIQRCIEELRIDFNGARLSVTISSGLAVTPDYTESPTVERVVSDADQQLYLSKRAGRNTWSYLGRSASRVAPRAPAPSPAACGM